MSSKLPGTVIMTAVLGKSGAGVGHMDARCRAECGRNMQVQATCRKERRWQELIEPECGMCGGEHCSGIGWRKLPVSHRGTPTGRFALPRQFLSLLFKKADTLFLESPSQRKHLLRRSRHSIIIMEAIRHTFQRCKSQNRVSSPSNCPSAG